jgi:hypothetical protein
MMKGTSAIGTRCQQFPRAQQTQNQGRLFRSSAIVAGLSRWRSRCEAWRFGDRASTTVRTVGRATINFTRYDLHQGHTRRARRVPSEQFLPWPQSRQRTKRSGRIAAWSQRARTGLESRLCGFHP